VSEAQILKGMRNCIGLTFLRVLRMEEGTFREDQRGRRRGQAKK